MVEISHADLDGQTATPPMDVDVHNSEMLAQLALQARVLSGIKGTPKEWIALYNNLEKAAMELANYIALMEVKFE